MFCEKRPQACNFLKKRLWQRCFLVSFAKFLRAPFLQNTSEQLLLKFQNNDGLLNIDRNWKKKENTFDVGSRGGSRTAATSKMELFVIIVNGFQLEAVNYYHKELHLGCCSSPRSASGQDDIIHACKSLYLHCGPSTKMNYVAQI